uniref:Uncharacterized protein n=1 Tax=viral metagenome TaxID=1070528 RepID=A0A6C0FB59_9ZZZZ|tara:strand:+ start:153 stop:401 length:249 start_codon:yes stop_codon:yes gene_type:complete
MGEMNVENVLLFLVGAFLAYHMMEKIEGIINCPKFTTYDINRNIWLKGKLVGLDSQSSRVRVMPDDVAEQFWMNCEDVMKRN